MRILIGWLIEKSEASGPLAVACYLEELLGKWIEQVALKKWQKRGMRQAKLIIGEQPSKS